MFFVASLLVSSIGFVAFYYGKGMHRFTLMLFGMAMMIYPYFLHSVAWMLAIAAALVALMWLALRRGW
jgi:hypothetical protein